MKRRNNNNSNNRNNQQGITNIVHKKRRTRRNVVLTSQLPSIVMKNILSSRKFQTLKIPATIGTVTGGTSIQFGSSGNSYFNIASMLAASNGFVDNLAIYQLFRITGLKLDVQRNISESAYSTVFTSSVLPSIFFGFLPAATSTNASVNLLQSSNSFEVDPQVTIRQRVSFTYAPIFSYNTGSNAVGSTFMYGMWNILSNNYTNMPGELAVSSNNTTIAASIAASLYTVTIYIDCEFSQDYP
jgi:hypothetical protein